MFSASDAAGPFNPYVKEDGNSVEGAIVDVSGLPIALLPKSYVEVGIDAGGVAYGVAICKGALVSYATPVV